MEKKNYLLPIIMMNALFFMIAFATGLQNPLGLIVKEQFALGNWGSQLPNFANFLAYAFMGIPAGLLLQRIGYKRSALTAIIVGITGVVIMYCAGMIVSNSIGVFVLYLIGAFVSGVSMCMLNTVVNPMLNILGGGGTKGNQLLLIGGTCNSIAATLAPVLGGYLIAGVIGDKMISVANPIFYVVIVTFVLTYIVLRLVTIPEPRLNSVKKDANDKHNALSFRHFKLGAVAIFIYVGVEVGIPNIANLYLAGSPAEGGLGMDTTIAGTVAGTYWFLMLVGRLLGMSIAAKVSARSMLSVTAITGFIFILLAIMLSDTTNVSMPVFTKDLSFAMANVPIGIMFFVLCGLCTSVMWGGIFNLAVEGIGKYTETGSGIFMVMVCGGGILPLLQGFIADKTSYLTSYIVVLIGLLYLIFYAFAGSKNVNRDIPVS